MADHDKLLARTRLTPPRRFSWLATCFNLLFAFLLLWQGVDAALRWWIDLPMNGFQTIFVVVFFVLVAKNFVRDGLQGKW